MIIDLTNNTSRIPYFQSRQPQAYFGLSGNSIKRRNVGAYIASVHNRARHGGMDGLGDLMPDGTGVPDTGIDMTKVNAEALYLVNLTRGAFGASPLPSQTYAPTVNVGVSSEAKALIGVGIAAALLFALSKSRK